MHAIDITSRLSDDQRLDFVAWLAENGRQHQERHVKDAIVTTGTSDGCPMDPFYYAGDLDDLTIVRDEKGERIGFALAELTTSLPFQVQRTFIQLDRQPTPFPASLCEFEVSA